MTFMLGKGMPKQEKELVRFLLGAIIRRERRKAGLPEIHVCRCMRRSRPWLADIETGRHDLAVKDLLRLSQCIGFDLVKAIRELRRRSRYPKSSSVGAQKKKSRAPGTGQVSAMDHTRGTGARAF
jgi:transcriptional regulator with XRE-family HTH domain